MACAASSLPVPLSPQISTAEFVDATRSMKRYVSFIAGLSPTMLCSIARVDRSRLFSPSNHSVSRAFSRDTAAIPAMLANNCRWPSSNWIVGSLVSR